MVELLVMSFCAFRSMLLSALMRDRLLMLLVALMVKLPLVPKGCFEVAVENILP